MDEETDTDIEVEDSDDEVGFTENFFPKPPEAYENYDILCNLLKRQILNDRQPEALSDHNYCLNGYMYAETITDRAPPRQRRAKPYQLIPRLSIKRSRRSLERKICKCHKKYPSWVGKVHSEMRKSRKENEENNEGAEAAAVDYEKPICERLSLLEIDQLQAPPPSPSKNIDGQ